MTKVQAEIKILKSNFMPHDWDPTEDEQCRKWFGKNYLGRGMIRCDYCKCNAVPFIDYWANHKCIECMEEGVM